MTKEERIKIIEDLPDEAVYVVTRSGQYWLKNDRGYGDDIDSARKFSSRELINMLKNNELIGKTIHMVKVHFIC